MRVVVPQAHRSCDATLLADVGESVRPAFPTST